MPNVAAPICQVDTVDKKLIHFQAGQWTFSQAAQNSTQLKAHGLFLKFSCIFETGLSGGDWNYRGHKHIGEDNKPKTQVPT